MIFWRYCKVVAVFICKFHFKVFDVVGHYVINYDYYIINQLGEEDKSTILKIIDMMLTKKKFEDFFNKNVALL